MDEKEEFRKKLQKAKIEYFKSRSCEEAMKQIHEIGG